MPLNYGETPETKHPPPSLMGVSSPELVHLLSGERWANVDRIPHAVTSGFKAGLGWTK